MNNFLSQLLGYLNAIIAFLIILGATATGTFFGLGPPSLLKGLVGWFIGCIIAIIVCGFLAILISIKDELKSINKNLTNSDKD